MADTVTKPETKSTNNTPEMKTVRVDPSNPPLTRWNWTPDVVAGILGGIFGLTLALLFGFFGNFLVGTSSRIFLALIMLGVAFGFAHICYHMELTGRRYFQQAFSMLTPFAIIYMTTGVVVSFLSSGLKSIESSTMNVGPIAIENPAAGVIAGISSIIAGPTKADFILWTAIFSGIIIIPFFIHSIRERAFKIWWLLPAIVPAGVCWLLSLLL